MSHVSAVEEMPLTAQSRLRAATEGRDPTGIVTRGVMEAEGIGRLPEYRTPGATNRPIANIQYDTAHLDNPLETLAHEATHVAQAVRQTDRASRGVLAPTASMASLPPVRRPYSFGEGYTALTDLVGYRNNPLEVGARRSAAHEVARESVGVYRAQVANIAKKVWAATQDAGLVKRRLQSLFPTMHPNDLVSAVYNVSGQIVD
jgi:hypothetical protein